MKFTIFIIFSLVFFLLFPINSILAIGIGAKPSSLDLELRVNQSKKAKILVYNLSQEPGIFQVFPDKLENWIKIEPDNFRLEARGKKAIKINILGKEEGRKATNLSILATPLNRKSFSVGPGIKIPLKITIKKGGSTLLASLLETISQNWIFVAGVLITILTGLSFIKYFRRRKKIAKPPANLPIEN